MDDQNNNLAVEYSPRIVEGVHHIDGLRRIDTATWSAERLNWLWEHVKEEKYCFDDLGENNAAFFIANLFAPCTEHYEYKDDGYFCILNLVAGVNGDFHSSVWGDVGPRTIARIHDEIYRHLIETWEINRMTTYVPDFNAAAKRLSIMNGYRYEGTIRQCFKKKDKYHDLDIFGMLRSEFLRKRGV